jgi:soluble lytic murein transglycosylase-like protein
LKPTIVAIHAPAFTKSFLGRVTASAFALALAALMFSPTLDIVRVPAARVAAGWRQLVSNTEAITVEATRLRMTMFDRESMMGPRALMDRWDPLIADAAQRTGVPADWIRAVMHVESGGRTMLSEDEPMTSHAGAVGIMQVMPNTYAQMRTQYKLGADPYDPRDNVYAGAAYLRWLHKRYGYPNMFAAYNGGPGTLEAYMRGERELPKETRNYLVNVTNIVARSEHHHPVRFAGLLPASVNAAP